MYNKIVLVFCAFILFFGCKTITIQQAQHYKTKHNITLGSIGNAQNIFTLKEFNTVGIPSFNTPLQIKATFSKFTKATHKAYLKSKERISKDSIEIKWDSIPSNLNFVELQIADKITLIKAINASENTDLKDYLNINNALQIVTQISVAFSNAIEEQLKDADAIFLEEVNFKIYELVVYKNGKKTSVIKFNDGFVFAYKVNHFCWKEIKGKLKIVDIIDEYDTCPFKTYRQSKKAKEKLNLYKL